MADSDLNLPFRGLIQRTSTERFKKGTRIDVHREGSELAYAATKDNGVEEKLEPVEVMNLEALVVPPTKDRPLTVVSFRHPFNAGLMLTAVFDEKDPRGEIDGVWVAEDDGGPPDDDEDC